MAARPGAEIDHTARLLESHGYHLEDEQMTSRFERVINAARGTSSSFSTTRMSRYGPYPRGYHERRYHSETVPKYRAGFDQAVPREFQNP